MRKLCVVVLCFVLFVREKLLNLFLRMLEFNSFCLQDDIFIFDDCSLNKQ